MQRIRFVVVLAAALASATPLAAQSGRAAPMLQSVTFDVVGAFDQRWRAQIEPLVFGRFTVGISGGYSTQNDGLGYYPYPLRPQIPCPIDMLCTSGGGLGNGPPYKAWSVDLAARWYPAALSFGGRRQAVAFYLGEFVGYHERRLDQQVIFYGCPACAVPADTLLPPPPPLGVPQYASLTQKLTGFEPGFEVGLRILPARHVVLDVGGRFRLATIEDPYQRLRPGDLDARLVVGVGVGW